MSRRISWGTVERRINWDLVRHYIRKRARTKEEMEYLHDACILNPVKYSKVYGTVSRKRNG